MKVGLMEEEACSGRIQQLDLRILTSVELQIYKGCYRSHRILILERAQVVLKLSVYTSPSCK